MQMSSLDQSSRFREASKYTSYIRTFGMIKPDAYTHIGKIIDAIEKSNFVIGNLKMTRMTLNDSQ